MSLKDNIIEKFYTLLKEIKISQTQIDESVDVLLARHLRYLMFDNIDELNKTAITYKISQLRLLLSKIIKFLINKILQLPTKEERLETFLDLTLDIKLICKSVYEVLQIILLLDE